MFLLCVEVLAMCLFKYACLMSFREKAQIMKKSGMKRVLLLGSGYVSGPVVEYLTRDEKTQVTVGEFVDTIVDQNSTLHLKVSTDCDNNHSESDLNFFRTLYMYDPPLTGFPVSSLLVL